MSEHVWPAVCIKPLNHRVQRSGPGPTKLTWSSSSSTASSLHNYLCACLQYRSMRFVWNQRTLNAHTIFIVNALVFFNASHGPNCATAPVCESTLQQAIELITDTRANTIYANVPMPPTYDVISILQILPKSYQFYTRYNDASVRSDN